MPLTIKSIVRVILATVGLLVVLAVIAFFWLRYEYSRAEITDPMSRWRQVPVAELKQEYPEPQPCRQQYPERRAWFGATHVHTAVSYDASAFGTTTTPAMAYAFARGEPIPLRLWEDRADEDVPVQVISAPLDFMAVTDHAGDLGENRLCHSVDSEAYNTLPCRLYRGDLRLPVDDDMQPIMRLASMAMFGKERSRRVCGPDGSRCLQQAQAVWQENQQATEDWLDRSADCRFTTLHGYEYTLANESSNLHRNVLFRSSVVPQAALSAKEARQPELLWRALKDKCIDGHPDCDVLAIPHNSNWSSGRMWQPHSSSKLPHRQKRALAELRAELEPLAEILQVKGDSECRNGIASVYGPADEFCDFEKLRPAAEKIEDCGEAIGSGGMLLSGCTSRYNFVRYALTAGLAERDRLGVNPFEMGIIAATDSHNGTPAANSEANFLGAHGIDRDPIRRMEGTTEVPGGIGKGSPVRYNPGGVAGVYATENSRAALFDAMKRRETFGTSGPRIAPRLFAGWDMDRVRCDSTDMLAEAYQRGVPMGGVLHPSQGSASPVFFATASQDSNGGLLQRLQIVKGWIDQEGRTRQQVHDIAGDSQGLASVDPQTCNVSGPGFAQLCTRWQDPDFDPGQSAVYYLRVLENPSCRWHHHDCLRLPEDQRPASCSDPELPWKIHERAWTSPIWYYPK